MSEIMTIEMTYRNAIKQPTKNIIILQIFKLFDMVIHKNRTLSAEKTLHLSLLLHSSTLVTHLLHVRITYTINTVCSSTVSNLNMISYMIQWGQQWTKIIWISIGNGPVLSSSVSLIFNRLDSTEETQWKCVISRNKAYCKVTWSSNFRSNNHEYN